MKPDFGQTLLIAVTAGGHGTPGSASTACRAQRCTRAGGPSRGPCGQRQVQVGGRVAERDPGRGVAQLGTPDSEMEELKDPLRLDLIQKGR
jgi:hypothetical protein